VLARPPRAELRRPGPDRNRGPAHHYQTTLPAEHCAESERLIRAAEEAPGNAAALAIAHALLTLARGARRVHQPRPTNSGGPGLPSGGCEVSSDPLCARVSDPSPHQPARTNVNISGVYAEVDSQATASLGNLISRPSHTTFWTT
jgi:hypothetical protein